MREISLSSNLSSCATCQGSSAPPPQPRLVAGVTPVSLCRQMGHDGASGLIRRHLRQQPAPTLWRQPNVCGGFPRPHFFSVSKQMGHSGSVALMVALTAEGAMLGGTPDAVAAHCIEVAERGREGLCGQSRRSTRMEDGAACGLLQMDQQETSDPPRQTNEARFPSDMPYPPTLRTTQATSCCDRQAGRVASPSFTLLTTCPSAPLCPCIPLKCLPRYHAAKARLVAACQAKPSFAPPLPLRPLQVPLACWKYREEAATAPDATAVADAVEMAATTDAAVASAAAAAIADCARGPPRETLPGASLPASSPRPPHDPLNRRYSQPPAKDPLSLQWSFVQVSPPQRHAQVGAARAFRTLQAPWR